MSLTEQQLQRIMPNARRQAGVFAAWFWSVNGLNALADQNEFNTITRRINGGLNGLQDRLELWGRARAVLCISAN